MIVEHVDVALWAVRMAPVGALHELPPLAPIAEIDGARGRREHQRTGIEHVRQRAGIVVGVRRDFPERDVAGCPHAILELAVRNRPPPPPTTLPRPPIVPRLP